MKNNINLIAEHLHATLKVHGFFKKNLNWNSKSHDFINVINIQTFSYSDENKIDFTLNVGIAHAKVYSIYWGEILPKYITEVECIFRERVGFFINEIDYHTFNKNSFTLQKGDSLKVIAEEIAQIIVTEIMPFFNTNTNLEYLAFALENNKNGIYKGCNYRMYLSIIYYLLNKREKAEEVFRGILADKMVRGNNSQNFYLSIWDKIATSQPNQYG